MQQHAAGCEVNPVLNEYNSKLSSVWLEQCGVIAVTETASQDWRLQRTVEQSLVDRVEGDKIAVQDSIFRARGINSEWVFGRTVHALDSSQKHFLEKCLGFVEATSGSKPVKSRCAS